MYLLLCVHGIGSNTDTQKINMKDFHKCFKKIDKGGYYKKVYDLKIHMIDWKTLVDKSKLRSNIAKCHIHSQINEQRTVFNLCAPDVLQYMSPHFRLHI